MKFDDNSNELFEAAKMLRQYCDEIECKNCIFCSSDILHSRDCLIADIPEDWKIEEAERGCEHE